MRGPSLTTAYVSVFVGLTVGGVFLAPSFAHAALTLVGTASNNTNNVSSMSIDVSSVGIADGDLVLFFGSCDGNGYDLPTGAGFTLLHDTDTGGSHNNILGYKIASGEPSSYTIDTKTTGERGIGIIAVYRGIDTADPIDDSNTNIGGSNTSAVITSITPSQDHRTVAVFVGTEDGNNGIQIVSSWPGVLVPELDNLNGPAGTGSASSAGAFADEDQTTASAVSGTISLSGSGGNTYWGTMAVVLNPAAEGGSDEITRIVHLFAGFTLRLFSGTLFIHQL